MTSVDLDGYTLGKTKNIRCKPRLTHAIFEWRHNLHALPGNPQLIGINVVRGAALLALVPVRLHGCAAILSVKSDTNHRRKVCLGKNTSRCFYMPRYIYTACTDSDCMSECAVKTLLPL